MGKAESDLSVYNEIFVKKIYEKKDFKILPGETWVDLGGYTGMFSKYAESKGATIRAIYEPFEKMNPEIKTNNRPDINIVNAAVDTKKCAVRFFIHPTGNFQRNTIHNHYKRIKMKEILVPCHDFKEIIQEGDCVKMDIEGSELRIIDQELDALKKLKKLVLEYHLDKDWSINRYYERIEKLQSIFSVVYFDKLKRENKRIFPSGRIIYCIK